MIIEKGEKSSKLSIKQFFFLHKTVFNKTVTQVQFKAQGSRLKAQGSRLKAQGSRLKAQGSRLEARNVTELNLNQA